MAQKERRPWGKARGEVTACYRQCRVEHASGNSRRIVEAGAYGIAAVTATTL